MATTVYTKKLTVPVDPTGLSDIGCANPNNARACLKEAEKLEKQPFWNSGALGTAEKVTAVALVTYFTAGLATPEEAGIGGTARFLVSSDGTVVDRDALAEATNHVQRQVVSGGLQLAGKVAPGLADLLDLADQVIDTVPEKSACQAMWSTANQLLHNPFSGCG